MQRENRAGVGQVVIVYRRRNKGEHHRIGQKHQYHHANPPVLDDESRQLPGKNNRYQPQEHIQHPGKDQIARAEKIQHDGFPEQEIIEVGFMGDESEMIGFG